MSILELIVTLLFLGQKNVEVFWNYKKCPENLLTYVIRSNVKPSEPLCYSMSWKLSNTAIFGAANLRKKIIDMYLLQQQYVFPPVYQYHS